mmetsp:Transcript_50235/g.98293  ORF Transcript_50235/g.98293 Transcript_50235/m.98293 type:complete len:278 (-) Transcript_50235:245-1078(-)
MENKKLEVIEGCVASNYPRTIYDNDEWAVFQNAYNEIFPEDAGIVGTYSFLFDYEVQDHPIRGRTIVTKEDLAPNAEIWWEEAWHCSFGEKQKFMSFLELLPSLAYQCEILLWAYVSKGKVSVELDPASFFNHADDEKMINMNSSSRPNRFIRAGEELLMNYSTFIEYDALPWFDKLRSNAWKETDSKSLRSSSKNENGEGVAVYHNTKEYNLLGAPKQLKSQKVSTKNGVEETTTTQAGHISLFPFTPLIGTIGIAIFVAVLVWRFIIRKKVLKTG